ncbi:MAG TPA: FAD-binding oxidoreductase [Methylomirabilota bacterium]|nr:FAD-binding oxidoreductase [Methylomirabilota bacterium]
MARRIAVIGGGVVGCSAAWHLAQRALGEVVLIERDRLGSGTTWHSAGNITWRPGLRHDATVLYAFETLKRLTAETEQDTGWVETGRLFLAHGAPALRRLEGYQEQAARRGVASRMVTGKEAAGLHPLLAADAIGGAWFNPLSGRVNPADLTAAYAKGARRRGVRILENCKATGLVLRDGRVRGVATAAETIEADDVVVAAGLWSRGLLAAVGVPLAQWTCEHFYLIADVTPRLPRQTPSFVAPEDLFYGREEVGGMMVGAFDEDAKTIDAAALPEPFAFTLFPPAWDKIAPYFQRAVAVFPALETAPIRRFVNGPESFTPDDVPLIGPVAGIDGLYVCTAMNSGGVTYSAAAGHMAADLVAGAEPRFPMAAFAPGRFGDRANDVTWLQREISAVVSRGYQQTNL